MICYFLADDTVEVREVRTMEEAKGAGSFPKFLKRQKLPKVRITDRGNDPYNLIKVEIIYITN